MLLILSKFVTPPFQIHLIHAGNENPLKKFSPHLRESIRYIYVKSTQLWLGIASFDLLTYFFMVKTIQSFYGRPHFNTIIRLFYVHVLNAKALKKIRDIKFLLNKKTHCKELQILLKNYNAIFFYVK